MLQEESAHDSFNDPKDKGGIDAEYRKRAESRVSQHRLYNDGRSDGITNWPWRVEYYHYKEW